MYRIHVLEEEDNIFNRCVMHIVYYIILYNSSANKTDLKMEYDLFAEHSEWLKKNGMKCK